MLQNILNLVQSTPMYLYDMWTRHQIPVIVIGAIFLFSAVFTNKLAYFLRWIYVLFCVGAALFGWYERDNQLLCAVAISIIVMILIRLLVAAIGAYRRRRDDSKFEREALKRSAARRGSFKTRQGYSGKSRPIDKNDYQPGINIDEELGKEIAAIRAEKEAGLTDLMQDIPSDPLAEIAGVKEEIRSTISTAQIDTDAVEAAMLPPEEAEEVFAVDVDAANAAASEEKETPKQEEV